MILISTYIGIPAKVVEFVNCAEILLVYGGESEHLWKYLYAIKIIKPNQSITSWNSVKNIPDTQAYLLTFNYNNYLDNYR